MGCIHAFIVYFGKIAEFDEISRMRLCQNLEWNVLPMLTAYATCTINTDFECDIFSTLTSFGKSAEISEKLISIFLENNVLSIIAAEHKMLDRGKQNRTCPLVDAMMEFLFAIVMASTNKFQDTTPFLKFIIETILLTSYDRYAHKLIICL